MKKYTLNPFGIKYIPSEYDIMSDIVRNITDDDPLAELTETDAVRKTQEARDAGYDVPDALTPAVFLELFEDMKPEV